MENKDLQSRVEKFLEKVKKNLEAHDGSVRLVEIKGEDVYLELQGACKGCPMAAVTLKKGIETQMKHEIPEIGKVYDINLKDLE
ncbi:NifU family protein [Patescibacteria group bacterium]